MKKALNFKLFLLFFGVTLAQLSAAVDHQVLLMYLKAPADDILKAVEQEINQSTVTSSLDQFISDQSPARVTQQIVKGGLRQNITLKLSGFQALYKGDSVFSNRDGLIYFPSYHISKKAYLVITPKIHMEKIKGETISHPSLAANTSNQQSHTQQSEQQEILSEMPEMSIPYDQPASMCKIYVYEKKENTQPGKSKYSYWEVREQPLPADRKINPLSIVLLTNPANIYVETGDFLSGDHTHLQLPSPYVVGSVGNEKAILEGMDIARYFKPVSQEHKKSDDLKSQTVFDDN